MASLTEGILMLRLGLSSLGLLTVLGAASALAQAPANIPGQTIVVTPGAPTMVTTAPYGATPVVPASAPRVIATQILAPAPAATAVSVPVPVLAPSAAPPVQIAPNVVVHPVPVPPIPGGVVAIAPQQATAVTTTYNPVAQPLTQPLQQTQIYGAAPLAGPAPATVALPYGAQPVATQVQNYTPAYYWYYYAPPAQTVPASQPAAVMVAPGMPHMQSTMDPSFAPLTNARGEAGHVRYPYYSYRRPWYFPGQPSFNVTIDGPVW